MYPDEFEDVDRIDPANPVEQDTYKPPRRVRQRLPLSTSYEYNDGDYGYDDGVGEGDDDELSRPRWTTRRVLLVVITLMIVISLLLLDLMPLLTQFWQSFPSDFFQRPDPTFIPGA